MGKKRKSQRVPQVEDPLVKFELEQDALELFHEYISHDDEQFLSEKLQEGSQATKSKKRVQGSGKEKIDLHGLSFQESIDLLEAKISWWLSTKSTTLVLEVVTGKGIHSEQEGGGVLCRNIHSFVVQHYRDFIIEIDEPPDQVKLGGLPIRGHFIVKLRK